MTVSLVAFLFVFVKYFITDTLGPWQLDSGSIIYESWYNGVVLFRVVYLALLPQSSFYQKIMKISPSLIDNVATGGWISLGCTLFISAWATLIQGSLTP